MEMSKPERIAPGEKVPVVLSAEERRLIVDHTFAGPDLTSPLETATVSGTQFTVRYTLDDLEELLGYIAAEANHTPDRKLRGRLDRLYDRLQTIEASYVDERSSGWRQN
ncbi:MAG: hypothetical protein OEM59_02745 [Rhodospirillales bacterium]|nr:hypothetical protein [Rhodospirillales bacterium]